MKLNAFETRTGLNFSALTSRALGGEGEVVGANNLRCVVLRDEDKTCTLILGQKAPVDARARCTTKQIPTEYKNFTQRGANAILASDGYLAYSAGCAFVSLKGGRSPKTL